MKKLTIFKSIKAAENNFKQNSSYLISTVNTIYGDNKKICNGTLSKLGFYNILAQAMDTITPVQDDNDALNAIEYIQNVILDCEYNLYTKEVFEDGDEISYLKAAIYTEACLRVPKFKCRWDGFKKSLLDETQTICFDRFLYTAKFFALKEKMETINVKTQQQLQSKKASTNILYFNNLPEAYKYFIPQSSYLIATINNFFQGKDTICNGTITKLDFFNMVYRAIKTIPQKIANKNEAAKHFNFAIKSLNLCYELGDKKTVLIYGDEVYYVVAAIYVEGCLRTPQYRKVWDKCILNNTFNPSQNSAFNLFKANAESIINKKSVSNI